MVFDFTKHRDGRIIKGKWEDILPLIEDKTYHMIVTDPPYGIGKNYNSSLSSNSSKDIVDKRPDKELWKQLYRILDDKGSLHMTVSNRHLTDWIDLVREAGFNYRHTSVYWNTKRRAGNMNGQFAYCWEPLLSFTKSTFKFRKRNFFDIYDHSGFKFTKHPAERNLWAWTKFVDHLPCGSILDPFAGVGTTAISAILAGCHHVDTIDVNPEYVNITKDRVRSIRKELEGKQLSEQESKYSVLDKMPLEVKEQLSRWKPDLLY